jgi:Spy/CpxP family protein refolding chaperone
MKKTLSFLLVAPLATAALALAQAPADATSEPAAPPADQATQETPPPTAKPVPASGREAMQKVVRPPVDRIIDGVLDPLELTPEQAQKIGEIRTAWVVQSEPLRVAVRTKALEYQTVSRSPSAAPADVEAKHAGLMAAREALQAEIDKLDEQIAAALDPARREKYLATREQMKMRSGRGEARPSTGVHPAPSSGH